MSYTSLEYAGAAVLVVLAFVPGVFYEKRNNLHSNCIGCTHTHIHKLKTVLCRRVCACVFCARLSHYKDQCMCAMFKMQFAACLPVHVRQRAQ